MQSTLIAGDSLDFLTTVADYPPADGWTLKYRLIPRTSGTAITLTASTSGTDYRTQAAPATTATWTAGDYSWSAWVEKTGARYVVDSGTCTIKPDPGVVAAYDGRSNARKIVDQLEAALVTFSASSGTIAEYEINGRRVRYAAKADILSDLSRWRAQAWREDNAAAMAEGLGNRRNVQVRFGVA